MRVATKLTLALGALGFFLFGGYGLLHAQSEARLLRKTVAQELDVVGRVLQVAIENALRDQQTADITETLLRIEEIAPSVDVVVFDEAGVVRGMSTRSPSIPRFEAEMGRRVRNAGEPDAQDAPDGSRLVHGLPLLDDRRNPLGAVVLGYPLDDLRAEIAAARRDVALVVLCFAALTAVTGLVLGTVYLGRPLQALVDAMRRVRAGDLATDLHGAGRRDEVGALTDAFNAMTYELRAARQRVTDEVERRRDLEMRLVRADKLIAVGHLAATLAHEIGSPLQVLVGRARALATREYPADKTSRHATIIADQAERIAGIVEDLLSFARRRPARAEPTDLPTAASSVLELLAGEADRRGVSVVFSAEEGLPPVVCDGARFQQVVFNLLKNALEASSSGQRVELSFTRDDAPGEARSPRVCMTVVDEGVGIPPDLLPRVGEPFFTTRSEDGGTGLGLAVAVAIVREGGGSIEIVSAPNEGTRVFVRHPTGE